MLQNIGLEQLSQGAGDPHSPAGRKLELDHAALFQNFRSGIEADLPLLLGVGVAFKIYYIVAWRCGETNFLQSSLTRAVFYSAATTAIAFGSLCFSHHPGTSSMGKLMALSLVTTLSAAVIFQPALLATQQQKRA